MLRLIVRKVPEVEPCRISSCKTIGEAKPESRTCERAHSDAEDELTNPYLLLPPRDALPYTEFSLELCREPCSLLFPFSTTSFIDIPPQGRPERFSLVSISSGSGDA
jgi:hypothetical protein